MHPTPAVITLAFDPVARLGDLAVRWETLGIAAAVLAAILVAGLVARRTPVDVDADVRAGILGPGRDDHLRRDDLVFVALGAVPGAVVGGRIGYLFLHLDYYARDTAAIWDPGTGGLELSLAVLGGTISAAVIASMLEAPIARWLHVAALPVLLAIGLGKAALVLGGTGQGQPSDLAWATAYAGPGPWGSLAPEIASHPAQAYEALVALTALLVVMALGGLGAFDGRDGRAFAVAVGLWAAGRAAVGAVWRDPPVLGPLSAGQLLAMGLVAVALLALVVAPRVAGRRRRAFGGEAVGDESGPEPRWPDPETRPRF